MIISSDPDSERRVEVWLHPSMCHVALNLKQQPLEWLVTPTRSRLSLVLGTGVDTECWQLDQANGRHNE